MVAMSRPQRLLLVFLLYKVSKPIVLEEKLKDLERRLKYAGATGGARNFADLMGSIADSQVPDLETLSYGAGFADAQYPNAFLLDGSRYPINDIIPAVDGLFLGETITPRRWDGSKLVNINHDQLVNILADQHHLRLHDHSLAIDGSPIAVAGVPNLPASKITTERFPMARILDGTLNYVIKGGGVGVNPAYGQVAHGELTGIATSDHHSQLHKATHHKGGTDVLGCVIALKFGAEGATTTSTTYVTIANSDIALNPALFKFEGTLYVKFIYHIKNDTAAAITYIQVLRQNAATVVTGSEASVTGAGWGIVETAWIDWSAESVSESYQLQMHVDVASIAEFNSALMILSPVAL